jgi:potassium-transporting ATPase KdpC subunit
MIRDFVVSIRSVLILWVITALIYPGLLLLIGQVAFPFQANGSLLTNSQSQAIGSSLIGQTFTADKYFWSRASAINYNDGEKSAPTGLSGASNLAPGNPALSDRIKTEITRLQGFQTKPIADLVYSSGSGLDPHISPIAAQAQIERVAKARAIAVEQLQGLIDQNIEGRFLEIFGEDGVNVLRLNLALDQLKS